MSNHTSLARELHELQLEPIIAKALEEDLGYGDWTTDLCVDPAKMSSAVIIAKENTVVCGVDVAAFVFSKVDPSLELKIHAENGSQLTKGEKILSISGRARSILKAERVALNFLGRMSGVANLTRQFVNELEGTGTELLDTRKTIPGLRILDKYAAHIGGARNHRFGLCDGVIVKENHIRAAGGIHKACDRLRQSLAPTIKIEVEVTNLEELKEAIDAGADICMLDNMSNDMMSEAVRISEGRVILEASGNVTVERIKSIAATGVRYISSSAPFHSSRWADLSLLFDK
jgi:nicotinate-nucleotide pyrophosphorylase (carboxylating)